MAEAVGAATVNTMKLRICAIMVLVVLATACGGEDAGPPRAGVNGSSSEAELPAAASVNLSDPERNQALDELDAILGADAGPEPVDQTAPVAAPESTPEPNPIARSTDVPPATATPKPSPSSQPTPSFTPDASAPQGPAVPADNGG